MIIKLTIFIMMIIIWSVYSFDLIFNSGDDNICPNFKEDGIMLFIAKLYWCILAILVVGGMLFAISYFISTSIICETRHNDHPVCERWEQK